MMFTLSYVLNATQTPVSGFELGHIEFKKGDEIISSIISSKIYNKNYDMMIFLSIVDLLYGVKKLLTSKQKSFEFVGADSSFIVWFERRPKSKICLKHKNKFFIEVSQDEFVNVLYYSSYEFWKHYKTKLSSDDIVIGDIESTLAEFFNQIICHKQN